MIHSRHLYVNTRALKSFDDAFIGFVFSRFVEDIQEQLPALPALLIVENSEGAAAFGEEPCDCKSAPEETA